MTPAKPATAHELREGAEAVVDRLLPEHPSLAAALVAALADLTVVATGRTVNIETKTGARIHYDYADLADVVRLTRPVLAHHGLVALTPVHAHGDGLACTVTLLHKNGERLDLGPFPFPHGRDAQATGSMVTYHRRYALVAALGMAAGDDDDGAAAKPRQAEPVRTVSPRTLAKNTLYALLPDKKDETEKDRQKRAAEAWTGFDGDNVVWGTDPAGQVTSLYEQWVNQPDTAQEALL